MSERHFLTFLLCLIVTVALGGRASVVTADDTCADCHRMLPDQLGSPVEQVQQDVHAEAGLSCADCHGGDPSDPGPTAMDPTKGYVGKPTPAEIPGFCARCHADESYIRQFNPSLHTDQLADYQASIHGRRLAEGDTKVATCVSCHGVHGILPVSDTRSPVYPTNVAKMCSRCHADPMYMADYKIPTDQFVQYQRSVHAEALLLKHDLSAPTCNNCHGNHGAYPPGAESVAAACGQCHSINRQLFVASPHHAAYIRLGLAECAICHGNHQINRTNDEMLGTGDVAVCITCHGQGSAAYEAAADMRAAVDRLTGAIGEAERVIHEAAAAGMEVTHAELSLRKAQEALVRARNEVHAANADTVERVADTGIEVARHAQQAGTEALRQLRARRWGALLPLVLLVLIAILVYRKIRDLEGRASGGAPPRAPS